MGLIERLFGFIFGGGRNVIVETTEAFRENAEAAGVREADARSAAMSQFGQEFGLQQRGWFDRFIDGVNRLPRPALALGTLGLIVSAMVDPIWFAERMQGLALVPEPLWWLLGVVVSFYFGARQQFKTQEFQRSIAATVAMAPAVVRNIRALRQLRHDSPGAADPGPDAELALELPRTAVTDNPPLEAARTLMRGVGKDR